MKKAKFLMTLAIAAMVGVFTACENTPNTPVGPGTGGEGGDSTTVAGPEATAVTVAEFIAAPESKDVYYELTGTIGGSIDDTYGNFDLTDETGTVYVYGLTAKYIAGGTNDKSYASLGLKAGDNITIRGYRGSYNDKVEVMGAFFVKKNSSGSGSETPGDVTGQGTKENPYTVADVIALNNTAKGPFYVKGYIVGQVGGQYLDSGSEFAAPWTTFTSSTGQVTTYNTNLLIAVSADETNVNNVVPVQLPSGALRNALNLPENPDMHKKEVLIYGNLEKYFGAPGIKSPTYAVVDGTEYGLAPDAPIVEPKATPATVAEFIAAAESTKVYYELTGTISAGEGTINTTYGNFDLVDETGSVYVYGLTATYIPVGGANDKSYASLGLNKGDNITIRGYRGSYNGKVEVMGAYFVRKN